MKKKIIGLLIIVIILGSSIVGFKTYEDYQSTDNYRFFKEFNVKVNSNVTYVNNADVFNKERAIFLIGANDELSKKIIPLFTNVIDKYEIINFYYLNIDEEKSEFEVIDDKLNKVKDGSEGYYQILEKLDAILKERIIKEQDKEYKTLEKEIVTPFVITIENQNILNYYEVNEKIDLNNNEERLKLVDIYSDLIVELID